MLSLLTCPCPLTFFLPFRSCVFASAFSRCSSLCAMLGTARPTIGQHPLAWRTRFNRPRSSVDARQAFCMADMAACISPWLSTPPSLLWLVTSFRRVVPRRLAPASVPIVMFWPESPCRFVPLNTPSLPARRCRQEIQETSRHRNVRGFS